MKKMFFCLWLVGFGCAPTLFAALHFIRAGAPAGGDGSSWSAAWRDFPDVFFRGDTYYVASGDYGSHSFGTAVSNATRIVIVKATDNDHGSDIGWVSNSSGYGLGQAWVGNLTFQTGYWTFDGSVGSGSNGSQYGFATKPVATTNDYVSFTSPLVNGVVDGVILRHLAVTCIGPSGDIPQTAFYTHSQTLATNAKLEYIFEDNCRNGVYTGSGWTIENSYFARAWSSAQWHGEVIDTMGKPNVTVRNNVFAQCRGTTCIGNYTTNNWRIYGNVFMDVETGNGVIGASGDEAISNTEIYNNTIINNKSSSFLYQNNPSRGVGSGNIVRNNLFYNSNSSLASNGGGSITQSNNVSLTVDPFVGVLAGNYQLKSSVGAGLALGAPYNMDPLGVTRGSDGNWDIGAFELGGAVPGGSLHPADTNSNSMMELNEATTFGACWKSNCNANATLDNASRAGFLWKASATGQYQYNSNATCPLCWEIKP